MIKCKGIKINEETPVIGYYYKEPNGDEFILAENDERLLLKHQIKPNSGKMYVGLYDDFGKMIFEGDRVRFQDAFETKKPVESEVYLTTRGVLVDYPITGTTQLDRFCDYGRGSFDRSVSCVLI